MQDNKNLNDEIPTEEEETLAEEADLTSDTETDGDEKPSRGEKKKIKKLETELSELEKKLSAAEKELCAASDKYLRLYAEYDNFRRRSAKEKEGTYAEAYIDALTQILPILDNLERAAAYTAGAEDSPVVKGLEMTLKSFSEALLKMGVEEIKALGEQFDPNIHEAVLHTEDENAGENEIVEVLVKGFSRGERILRHPVVKVAN